MKQAKTIAIAGVAAFVLMFNASAQAQQIDTRDRTIVTFSGAVELPGVTLPAGTYVWRLLDVSRNVIQVLDKNERHLIGQFLYVSAERRDGTDDTVITFKEKKAGTTPAIQYWFYPVNTIGKEFIYPKDQALKIAARTGAKVKTGHGVVDGSRLPPPASVAAAEPVTTQAVGTSGSGDQSAAPTDSQP